ncbi:basement membrane-specific heparan sulfate proteoglycan core protein isoform X2 [Kryptolebias marmoratus]|uniref:basement membrane-specific heparan sulfate proteoglycan core protein isoform X2 n=1 Tax=Kryptolebias marmoratus TaxID=37003 RepID=UPI0007F8B77D|nr:basement membrane-specific heparan sulfate proteoglycan core protein isoform X2 [Kryptolebias marmoratus]
MTQLSNTASTCENQWKMWLLEVFAVMYLAAVCVAQDNTASTQSTPPPTTVYVPPKPVLELKSGRPDVYTKEKVELECKISGSDWLITWQNNGTNVQSPDLSASGDGSVLTIASATTADSGNYVCLGKHKTRNVDTESSNSHSISVTEPPIPTLNRLSHWSDVFVGESVKFSCEVSNPDWTFTWYRDTTDLHKEGPQLHFTSVTKADQGQYACKVKLKSRAVYSEFSKPADLTVNENKPKPTVTRSLSFNPMYPGESITFTCAVGVSTGWEYVWYHNGKEIHSPSNDTYSIPSLAISNSGEYYCKAKRGETPFYTEKSDTLTLQVSDPPKPAIKPKTKWLDMFETEAVEFSCEVSNSSWTFSWKKDNTELPEEGSSLKIPSVTAADAGQYSCRAHLKSRRVASEFSNTADVTVHLPPKPVLELKSGRPDVYTKEKVELECKISGSDWLITWQNNGTNVQSPDLSASGDGSVLTIASATTADSGNYVCLGKHKTRNVDTESSNSHSISVTEPPIPTLNRLSHWSDVFVGESVKFSCEVSNPDWTFTWYRDTTDLHKEGPQLHFTSVTKADQGQYACKVKLKSRAVYSEFSKPADLTVNENKPKPTVTRSLSFNPMYPGESITFTCAVGVSTGWEYVWYHNGKEIHSPSNDTYSIPSLAISNSGEYYCKAKRGETPFYTEKSDTLTLQVSEIPVPKLNNVTQWLDLFPTETAKLRCQMQGSDMWTFTWYRNTREVKADDTVNIENNGKTLSIKSASASHRGNYTCSGKLTDRSVGSNKSSKLMLHVYDAKPTAALMQDPKHNLMHTGDSVSFSCHISVSSGWGYLWEKDGRPLQASGNQLNISSVKKEDSGSYKCQVKRGKDELFKSEPSQVVELEVEERPQASLVLLTGWSEVFATDSLVLKCEVEDKTYTWNYTWFREEKLLNLTPSEKHIVTPQANPEQGHYTCQGIRNERPFYSRTSEPFKTKNLLLKRRVLLSISGCLFFGIIAVFLGCIACRVFRKPAADGKPEEPNLFLTMAQLKDSTNAPCPLVEYITDADLNPPQKEGEEDETVCSETTPLPVSTQEEQAVTTNSQGTTENGGGMVSFQH